MVRVATSESISIHNAGDPSPCLRIDPDERTRAASDGLAT